MFGASLWAQRDQGGKVFFPCLVIKMRQMCSVTYPAHGVRGQRQGRSRIPTAQAPGLPLCQEVVLFFSSNCLRYAVWKYSYQDAIAKGLDSTRSAREKSPAGRLFLRLGAVCTVGGTGGTGSCAAVLCGPFRPLPACRNRLSREAGNTREYSWPSQGQRRACRPGQRAAEQRSIGSRPGVPV